VQEKYSKTEKDKQRRKTKKSHSPRVLQFTTTSHPLGQAACRVLTLIELG
jgi:hypothetical protein